MTAWIVEHLFSSLWGVIGTTGVAIIACLGIAYVFPASRKYVVWLIVLLASAATIYGKGNRDRAKLEQKRKDEAVAKAKKDYKQIDARKDTDDDVQKRLNNGNF